MRAINPITWIEGVYDGDNRHLAMCGLIAVGAVFYPGPKAVTSDGGLGVQRACIRSKASNDRLKQQRPKSKSGFWNS